MNENELKKIEIQLTKLKAYTEMYRNKIDEYKAKISDLEQKIAMLDTSIQHIQSIGLTLKNDIVLKFEELITEALREVFEDNYKFKINFSKKLGRMNADFYIQLPDGKIVDIYNGEGGGVKDFVALLIRILYFELDKNKRTPVMFLDENLKFLDKERAIKAINFIKKLCNKLNIQVLFITHQQIDEIEGNIIKIC